MRSLLNGGVIIVSKWPIIHEAQHIYRSACHYSDCLAAKGVKYARVLKTIGDTSKIFNVFATHMQVRSRRLAAGCASCQPVRLTLSPAMLRRGQRRKALQIASSKPSRCAFTSTRLYCDASASLFLSLSLYTYALWWCVHQMRSFVDALQIPHHEVHSRLPWHSTA